METNRTSTPGLSSPAGSHALRVKGFAESGLMLAELAVYWRKLFSQLLEPSSAQGPVHSL